MALRLIVKAMALAFAVIALTANAGPIRPPADSPALLHPIERIAYSNDWRRRTHRMARLGEWVFVIIRMPKNGCVDIRSNLDGIAFRQMLPITIEVPSGDGGKTGSFHEIITPRNAETCQRSRYVLAEWRLSEERRVEFSIDGSELRVDLAVEATSRTGHPFFVGMGNANLIRGHCPIAYCPREGELGRAYAELFMAHGMQPMQNWAALPPIRDGLLDLDDGRGSGRSFRQLVMASAISGFVGFPRARRYPDQVAYLAALERTVRREGLVGRAWVYAADEPGDLVALADELKLYRRHAPSIHVMVTTDRRPELDSLIDVYAPVFNRLLGDGGPDPEAYTGKMLWTYASCMGSCGPNRAAHPTTNKVPGPDTGLPDFLIDRPAKRMFAFFEAAVAHGIGAGLYYEATEGYRLIPMGIDIMTDTWNFGGNGDGLLVFPGSPGRYGLERDQPLASFRMKLIRHALQTYW